jgi:hypothetical protein
MNGHPYTTSLTVCSTHIHKQKQKRHSWNTQEQYSFVKAFKKLMRTLKVLLGIVILLLGEGDHPTGAKILALMRRDGIYSLTRVQVTSHLQVPNQPAL